MSDNVASTTARRNWLWQPNLIVFISSGCIMILELVAGRMIAPHVGSSLYTWTGIIGVVLAGISLGNYLGGRFADKWASMRFLGIVYMIAAASCLVVLGVDRVYRITPGDWSLVIEILALTAAMFFIPCTILGMISPIVAKLAVSDLATTGSTVGKIYAAGALGSIVGTFVTGFFLISWFGTYNIVMGVALALFVIGLLFLLNGRWQTVPISLLVIIGMWYFATNQGWLQGPCLRETNYFCIKTYDQDIDGKPVRQLILDHLVHSFVSLENPKHLEYGYEKIYAEVADYRAATDKNLSVLMIGGGGYTFARYMANVYPGSDMNVIEIDPGVTQFAYEQLAMKPEYNVKTFNEDARMFMARPPTKKFDLILGDAFNHFSVPYHLTTKEFNERVKAWLADDGMYVINLLDGPYGEFARASIYTMQQTFKHVYVFEGSSNWRETTRSFFVLIGTDTALDTDSLSKFDGGDGDSLWSRALASDAEIKQILTEAKPVLLTDQYAPVDQMLASVFTEELPKKK